MTRRNMGMVLNSEPMATNCSLATLVTVGSARCGKLASTDRFSKSDWALISRNSSSTASSSGVVLRSLASTRRASSSRPWWTSHRGEKGMKIMPKKRISAGTSCRHSGTSQAASLWVSPVPPM